MNTPARLAAFAVALIVAFGAAFGLGRAVGTTDTAEQPVHHEVPASEHQPDSSSVTTAPAQSTDHQSTDHPAPEGGHP
ncbi:MAG: hypothetical protein GX643_08465 [Acidimicrobiales bacterium]|nr:hypothetical protein [Acidimicrobiales bacterium]